MRDVFISHAEEDDSVALEVALRLEEVGYNTWIDDLDTKAVEKRDYCKKDVQNERG